MPNVKIDPDIKRFVRYQSVVNALLVKDSFNKPDIYDALKNEKSQFIGRVISELVRDGYLNKGRLKAKPRYSWSDEKENFNPGRWIDHRVFTPTVKRSPFIDRPRERLLRLGPSPDFLMQCIRGCPAVLAQIQSETQGVTRPGINGAILKRINIPLPPITEQHEIIRRVEAMFKLADTIEERVTAATARTEKLTQAILAKAFRGELVPTEAEVARREGRSYESASELLARIKSERESR
jgi:hypothetical protein